MVHSHCAQPKDVDFWIEPRAKKINVPLACPAWPVRTIKDASKSTMTVSTWVENFTWKHQRIDPRGEFSLKLKHLPTEVEERHRTRPFDASRACGTYEASHQSEQPSASNPGMGGSHPSGCQPKVQRGLWGHVTQAQETS